MYPDWISGKKKTISTMNSNSEIITNKSEVKKDEYNNKNIANKEETLKLYQKIKEEYSIGEEIQLHDGYFGNIVHFHNDTVEIIIKTNGTLKNRKVSYLNISKIEKYKEGLSKLISENTGELQRYLKDLYELRGFGK